MTLSPFQPFRPFGGGGIQSIDPDAASYIALVEAAGVSVSAVQIAALNAFVAGEKSASRWALHRRMYLPIWGNAAANAICMVSGASGSFVGGISHAAGYWQSDGSTGYFNTAGNMSADGLSTSSGMMFVARKAVPAGITIGTMGNTAPGRVLILPQAFGRVRSDWGDTSNIFVTTDYNDNIDGIFVSTRTSAGIRHSVRTAGGRLVQSATVAASGSILSGTARVGNIAIFWDTSHYLAFGWGLDLSDAAEAEFTAALKTLWETCTGLSLP